MKKCETVIQNSKLKIRLGWLTVCEVRKKYGKSSENLKLVQCVGTHRGTCYNRIYCFLFPNLQPPSFPSIFWNFWTDFLPSLHSSHMLHVQCSLKGRQNILSPEGSSKADIFASLFFITFAIYQRLFNFFPKL